MKDKIIVACIIIIAVIALIAILFAVQYAEKSKSDITSSSGEAYYRNIIDPDRMVYKNKDGQYYEFLKGTAEYNEIRDLTAKSIDSYRNDGRAVNDEQISNIYANAFLEFDYKVASKNYLISLDENQGIIQFGDTGGQFRTTSIQNFDKIKSAVESASKGKKAYAWNYKEMTSKYSIKKIQDKNGRQLKETNSNLYQAKIDNIEDYNLYKNTYNLAFDEEITPEVFDNNVLVLTISSWPKISVKVNIGSIKYLYGSTSNANGDYTAYLLIVSKIVNTDCIYNTYDTKTNEQSYPPPGLSEEDKKAYENTMKEYDNKVDNLDTTVFVKDFDKFFEEYNSAATTITESQAKVIADKGFIEAERVVGSYLESSERMEVNPVFPNNFFTAKSTEGPVVYNRQSIEAYCFTRVDDMQLNGVSIYVDKRLGKIIGADAFGD